MGVRKTEEWSLSLPPDLAHQRIAEAMRTRDIHVEEGAGRLTGKAPLSLRRNRREAHVSIELRPAQPGGTAATATVEMVGHKQQQILDELVEAVGRDVLHGRSGAQPEPDGMTKLERMQMWSEKQKLQKLENQARDQEQRALKMSKKIGRGGRRAARAAQTAEGLHNSADRLRQNSSAAPLPSPSPPPPPPRVPADWYPDPNGEKRLRYWDGTAWTKHAAD